MTQMIQPLRHTPTLRNALPRAQRGADQFWPVLRDLVEARTAFGLRRPVLATLRALISFLEEGSVVFASNRSIAARAEGVSESALRRHIRNLIDLGLLERRDSSNGKRYRLEAEGHADIVFGLDLAPLGQAAPRIAEAAAHCREENRLIRYLRKRLGQLIYLARSQGCPEARIEPYQRALRQKLSAQDFGQLCHELDPGQQQPLLEEAPRLEAIQGCEGQNPAMTSKMTARDSQNDCHKNISEERLLNPVGASPDQAPQTAPICQAQCQDMPEDGHELDHISPEPSESAEPILLRKAQSLAPDAFAFADRQPQSWTEVEALAWRLANWSGICPRLLGTAIETSGRRLTAMAVLTITQNAGRIRNPGAYFRTLTLGRHHDRFARPLKLLN